MNILKLTAILISLTLASHANAGIQRISVNPDIRQEANIVQLEILINAPIEDVWTLVAKQFDQSKLFNVEAKSTAYIRGSNARIGSQRRTIGNDGTFIDVEIYAISQKKYIISWEIIATDVARLVLGYSSFHLETTDGGTTLTQTAGFKMQSPVMDLLARSQFPRIFRTELAGIKHYLEQNEQITKTNKRALRSRYFPQIVIRKSY